MLSFFQNLLILFFLKKNTILLFLFEKNYEKTNSFFYI